MITLTKPTVLISEGNPRLVRKLARDANFAGLCVLSDTSSRRTIELARTLRPDVVILGLHQAIDGRDLLAQLRRAPETADIPVVVLTARDDLFVRRNCIELGAHEVLVTPVDSVFMTRIARLAQRRAAQLRAGCCHPRPTDAALQLLTVSAA